LDQEKSGVEIGAQEIVELIAPTEMLLAGRDLAMQRRLSIYRELLGRWQKTVNLVAASTVEDAWRRHFLDSLQLLPLAGGDWSNWIDLGSGGGFPGMVIAIAAGDENRVVHLVESDKRKVAFLREVSRETCAKAEIHVGRIENILPEIANRVHFDVVSARALAPLNSLINYAHPVLKNGAVGLFLKGKGWLSELTDVACSDSLDLTLVDSQTEATAKIVVVRWHNSQTNAV
jgi:16S rRNA (guanine527-N7)-methyltransferase